MQTSLAAAADMTGAAMQRAGEAILGGLGKAVEVAGSYDQALRDVSAVNKLTEKQFGQLHDSILELTKDPLVVQGPTELATGMYRVASAGFEGEKGLEVLHEAAIGATAGLSDTKTSSLALIAALKSYPEGLYTARQAMDLLIGEVDNGVNTFPELAKSIGRVLPIASQAHVGLDEVTAAIATLTRGGLSASEAVTALTQFIKHIVEPSKGAAKAMDAMGIAHGAAAFAGKGLYGVLQQVSEKTHGNVDAMAKIMPELRSLIGGMTLAKERGSEYEKVLESQRGKVEGAGAAHQVAAEQAKGFGVQLKKATQEVEVMKVEIGQHLMPVVRDLIKDVRDLVSWFIKLPPKTQENIVKFAALSGVILTVGGSLLRLIGFAIRAGAALGTLAGKLTGVIDLAKAMASTLAGNPYLAAGGVLSAETGIFGALQNTMWRGIKTDSGGFGIPGAGGTNIAGGQVNALERRRYLTGEIAKLERAIATEQTSGIVVAPAIAERNRSELATLKGELAALPGAAAKASSAAAKGTKNHWSQAGADSGDAYIKNLLAKLNDGGKSGRAAASAAKKAAKQAAKDAKEIADQIQEANEAKFEATHSDYENQKHQAYKTYKDRTDYDPDNTKLRKAAHDELIATLNKIEKEHRDELKKTVKDQMQTFLDADRTITEYAEKNAKEQEKLQKDALKGWIEDLAKRGKAAKEAAAEEARAAKEAAQRQAQYHKEAVAEQNRINKEAWQAKQKAEEEKKKEAQQALDDAKKRAKEAWQKMEDDAQSILVDHLTNALQHGFKKGFKGILQDFEQLLSQMAAKAIISGIFNMFGLGGGGGGGLFGQGGPGGFLGGVLSAFGFDDGGNDATAKRWGWDAMSMFSRGATDYLSQRQPGRAAGAGGAGGSHVTVNMYGDQHYHNDMDARRVGETVAWHAQNRLVVARAPKR